MRGQAWEKYRRVRDFNAPFKISECLFINLDLKESMKLRNLIIHIATRKRDHQTKIFLSKLA